jgi:uroporphyrinogen decarboxylase
LADLEEYGWPDPDWIEVSGIRQGATRYQGRYAILGGEWSPFWHDAIDLVGMDGLLCRMYDQPEFVDRLLKHIVDFYAEVNRRTFDAAGGAIDIFFMGNDFGGQTGPLMGESMFRRFLVPPLRRLTDLSHDYHLKAMLHCCGGIAQLIPAMLEAGIDGLQAVQPSCAGMDLEVLKSLYGGKLVFNGCIDSQHVLLAGTPSSIRQSVREILAVMKPGGGYIASASHNSILEETPVANVLAMFEAIHEYGAYE